MAKETMIMLVGSIEAFVDKDLEKANEVIKRDDVVDDLFNKVKKELIQMIHENADKGEQAADLLMVAKYMERIGDHATNISEWVIFSITGEHKKPCVSGKSGKGVANKRETCENLHGFYIGLTEIS